MLKNKRIYIMAGLASLILITAVSLVRKKVQANRSDILFPVKEGAFEITVTTTGELEAENKTNIMIPSGILRDIKIWEIKLARLLPEGTLIDSGQIVAELDPATILEKKSEIETSIQAVLTEVENAKADTAYELSVMHDKLENTTDELQDLEFALEQSRYESPAVIKQAERDLEKARRDYQQELKNYDLKKRQGAMKIRQIGHKMYLFKQEMQKIEKALSQAKITSPAKGMLVYHKDRQGKQINVGSVIPVHADQVLAFLPDFSGMISSIYVNEGDISLIQKGQKVRIEVDAFPDKEYWGRVSFVANIGEDLEGSNSKVFRVITTLDSTDLYLRPGMTTTNTICINSFPDKLSVPIEAVHTNEDFSYVFMKKGIKKVKKQVRLGEMNDNFIIVEEGLKPNDQILLNIPEKHQKLKIVKL